MGDKTVLSIGGGKGGVGKSIVLANLGVELAIRGKKTILVDMDFGAANLHLLLGMEAPAYSFKDFMMGRKNSLEEIIIDTGINNLQFLSSAGDIPGSANPKYFQKLKIINHIEKLNADYILLDIGPGHTYNVIDYGLTGDILILITTPESTAIINVYSFIKSIVFRKLDKFFHHDEIKRLIQIAKDPDNPEGIKSVDELLDRICKVDEENCSAFRGELKKLKTKLIVNMANDDSAGRVASIIATLGKRYVGIDVDMLGHIYEDDSVRRSVTMMKPFVIDAPHSRSAGCIRAIADKLLEK